jgi:hypothetical protein
MSQTSGNLEGPLTGELQTLVTMDGPPADGRTRWLDGGPSLILSRPTDWCLERFGFVPGRVVVDEAVERIRDGSITQYVYDPKSARLVRR